MYYPSMPLYRYNLTPCFDFDKEIVPEEMRKKYNKVLKEFDVFNLHKNLYSAIYFALRDGFYVGYMYDSKVDGKFLMPLDVQYCRILGKNSYGEWVVYFDATYFELASNVDFIIGSDGYVTASSWDQVFIDGYNSYRQDKKNKRWFRLPPEKTCVLLAGPEDEFTYPLPFFLPLFGDLLDMLDLQNILQSKVELENYKLIVSKIPLLDDNTVDDFAISMELAKWFDDLLATQVHNLIRRTFSRYKIRHG